MNVSIHHHIKRLIEDTNDAYGIYSSAGVNADYAEFAALSLYDFKSVLDNPDLTESQLISILRQAIVRHKTMSPRSCWATFLSNYIANKANSNAMSVVRQSWGQNTPVAANSQLQ